MSDERDEIADPAIMPALLLISRRTNNLSRKSHWLPF
jgi:hypothetical protein